MVETKINIPNNISAVFFIIYDFNDFAYSKCFSASAFVKLIFKERAKILNSVYSGIILLFSSLIYMVLKFFKKKDDMSILKLLLFEVYAA